eukprot:scaffold758_cov387-Pavlova_lutheri.AAC.1
MTVPSKTEVRERETARPPATGYPGGREGLESYVAPTNRVNPLELRPFKEERRATKPANLAAIQLRSQDDTVLQDSKYHVEYSRDRSTFQISDLTTGVGEHPSTVAHSQVVVNLALIGFASLSQTCVRPRKRIEDTVGHRRRPSHYVRSVFANGQAHTTNELLQLLVLPGPGDPPTKKTIEVKAKVIPMDLPASYDLIFGFDVMSQLQASLNLDRNTIQLTHRNQTVTLVQAKFKTGETSPVNGLASASVSFAEQHAHHPVSFSTMEEEFGPFKTALFLATTTGLATLNYAEPEEAMRQDWGILPGPIICVPPLRLLPQVTQKLQSTAPLSLVLLAPFMPTSPWFRELRPFIQKGRVIPSADTSYGYEAATQASSATTCPMVALQINRHASAEPTTLSAIQESRPTITRTTIESLELPETLDPAQQKQLKDLLGRYMHLMQPPGDNEPPPAPSEFDHRIVLTEGGTQRVQTRPIRLAADQTIELQKRFEHRCNRGIMRKAASDSRTCRSAVFMVKRKDGPDRDVVDFKALNEVTVKDHFPLPLIDELLDGLSKARYFISVDLKEAYYNIRMHPDSIRNPGTITHFGLFEWLILVMGMCNAVATFQRMMDA